MSQMTILIDGKPVFDRKVNEVDVTQDIHGNLTATAKYEPVTPDALTDALTNKPVPPKIVELLDIGPVRYAAFEAVEDDTDW